MFRLGVKKLIISKNKKNLLIEFDLSRQKIMSEAPINYKF